MLKQCHLRYALSLYRWFESGSMDFFKSKDRKYTMTWFHCSKSLWLVANDCVPNAGLEDCSWGCRQPPLCHMVRTLKEGENWRVWSKTIYQISWPGTVMIDEMVLICFNHSVANLKSQVLFRGMLCKVIPLVGFGWHQLVTTADGRNAASACRQDAFVNPAQLTFNWDRFPSSMVSTLSRNTHTMFNSANCGKSAVAGCLKEQWNFLFTCQIVLGACWPFCSILQMLLLRFVVRNHLSWNPIGQP